MFIVKKIKWKTQISEKEEMRAVYTPIAWNSRG